MYSIQLQSFASVVAALIVTAFKGKTKGTPLWGTRRLKVLKRYHLRL